MKKLFRKYLITVIMMAVTFNFKIASDNGRSHSGTRRKRNQCEKAYLLYLSCKC